jgi:hypothetical protein
MKKNVFMLAVVLIMALALAGLYSLHNKKVEKRRKIERIEAEEKKDAAKALVGIEEERMRQQKEQAWKLALELKNSAVSKNQNYDEAVKKFEEIAGQYPDSEFSKKAESEIQNLKSAKNAGIKEVLDGLKHKADELIDKKEYSKIAELYSNYEGPFSAETTDEREKIKADMLSQITNVIEKQTAEKGKLKEELLDSITAKILAADLPGTIELLEKSQPEDEELKEGLEKLRSCADEAAGIDAKLLEALAGLQGTTITVLIGNKPETLKVTKVEDTGAIYGEQTIGRAVIVKKFTTKNILIPEKLRLLNEQISEEAKHLCLLMQAVEGKKWKDAKKYVPPHLIISELLSSKIAAMIEKSDTLPQTAQTNENTGGDEGKTEPREEMTDEDKTEPGEKKAEDKKEKTETAPAAIKLSEIVLDAKILKKSKTEGGVFDDKVQTVRLSYSLENKSFEAPLKNHTINILVIGQLVNASDSGAFLIKENIAVNLEPRKKMSGEKKARTEYDNDNYSRYGFKYYAYLVLLSDGDGKIIKSTTSKSSLLKIADKLLKLENNATDGVNIQFDIKTGEKIQAPISVRPMMR